MTKATDPISPLRTVTCNPVDTCISRDTFRILPLEVQIEYALHYRQVTNAENLDSEDICAALYTYNEWIPALKGHLSISTVNGLVVGRNAMDIVDCLVEQSAEAETASKANGNDTVVDESLPEWLFIVAEDLLRQYEQIKTRNANARLLAREVAADVFELQARLAKQLASHTRFVHAMEGLVGEHVARHVEGQVNIKMDAHDSARSGTESPRNSVGTGQGYSKSLQTPLHLPSPTPRIHKSERRGLTCHSRESPVSPIPPTLRASIAQPPIPVIHNERAPLKRIREDNDSNYREGSNPNLQHTGGLSTQISDHERLRKRRRLGQEGTSSPVSETMTPGRHSSRENSINDSSYSPTSGTVSSVMTQIELAQAERERFNIGEVILLTDDEISYDGNTATEDGVEWHSYYINEDDDSGSSYTLPAWTPEDIMEMGRKYDRYYNRLPVDSYNAMDDAILCGPLSSSGLSTDDSSHGYYNTSTLQHSLQFPPKALPMHAIYNEPLDSLQRVHYDVETAEETAILDAEYFERRKETNKQRRWFEITQRLKNTDFVRCNVDERISELFASDRTKYDCDDDTEWLWFEKVGAE